MALAPHRGFALLVAVVFVSVMLAFGTALGSLGYKQQILAANATRSQYAFYAADAALECALVEAQALGSSDPFLYTNHGTNNRPDCGDKGVQAYFEELCYNTASCPQKRVTRQKFEIAFENPLTALSGEEESCAEVTVYETNGKTVGTTYLFAQGYDVPCADVVAFQAGNTSRRIITRGIFTHF